MLGLKSRRKLTQEIENEQKEQKENQLKWYHYLLSALFVLSGAVFIGYTTIDIPFICKFLACVFAAAGVISIFLYCFKDVSAGYYKLELVYGVGCHSCVFSDNRRMHSVRKRSHQASAFHRHEEDRQEDEEGHGNVARCHDLRAHVHYCRSRSGLPDSVG